MSIRRSAAAFFGALFMLQRVLAGSVAACGPADAALGRADTHVVTNVRGPSDGMHGMIMAPVSGETDASEPNCDHPVSPQPCETMAPCAIGFMPAKVATELQAVRVIETVVATHVAMPPSVSFPPRHRPPRA